MARTRGASSSASHLPRPQFPLLSTGTGPDDHLGLPGHQCHPLLFTPSRGPQAAYDSRATPPRQHGYQR
ncbi:hypothetical protein AAG906_041214 [Vitis piasezkii]